MKKMNVGVVPLGDSQKGITLIALIITIIVMLILVGVTINVALNGGLFEKADTASKQTQKEVDKEMLLSAVVATVDKYGNYNLDQVQEHLPEGEFTYNNTTKVYKSKTGNEFTIDETTGKVTEVTISNSGGSESTEETNNSGNAGNTEPAGVTYFFTLGDVVQYGDDMGGMFQISGSYLFSNETIEDLKDSITANSYQEGAYYFNKVECSNSSLTDMSASSGNNIEIQNYYILACTEDLGTILLRLKINGNEIRKTNYQDYSNLTFTITK